MLKTIRVVLAVLSIVAVTLLFVDFTGTTSRLWPWMAKIQFIPALLSVNVLAIIGIVAATLIFGRVYCSVVCPLGIAQDLVNWVRGKVGKKKNRINRFKYRAPRTKTRLIVLTVFLVLLILGLVNVLAASIAGLIEPYSAYGRIATAIFAPAYDGINNLLASWSESRVDDYTFYRVAISVFIPVLIVAIVTLVVIAVFAWRGGRDYCNTICPVGTMLGYLSKFSLLKPIIDTSKCINCGKCGRNCKAKCINTKEHHIDYTRCVACMDCINVCQEGAIKYTWRKQNEKAPAISEEALKSRRGFVFAAGLLAGSAIAKAAGTADGGLTPMKKKQPHARDTRIVPAGAQSLSHLSRHCTACQLCVQSCPNGILKPNLSIDGFMQPSIDYTDGYCATDCTVCSNICPAGAFHPIDEVQKSAIKVGCAVVNLDACLAAAEGVRCGSCARHCPTSAIKMAPREDGSPNWMPVVNQEMCIGCGKCEFYCPVGTVASMDKPSSAIHVEGILVHREI